jgi:ribose transport system permease protein
MGSIYGLAGVVTAWVLTHNGAMTVAILAGLGVGVFAGLVNGLLSAYFRLPSFIVTLGTLQVLQGTAMTITDGAPIGLYRVKARGLDALYFVSQSRLYSIPMQFIVLLLLACLCGVILHRSTYGLRAYAAGGSGSAARLSGIRVARIQTIAFIVNGILSAIAGIFALGFIQSAAPTAGQGVEFSVFAAAVLGGANLFGGQGSIVGAILGAALLGLVNNALILLNVSVFWQIIANGLVVIVAVGVNRIVSSSRAGGIDG